ncbi:DUF2806 domain-containing protein [Bradyrhizobium sp. Leo170]|uniref:DUF2806 domain-containing protein n=1 Tax=Bradyrhizobium sp. Leo170 TaxID=1571199 RepID=UPI00102E2710|nr:DUF2806 domain-containing protein [Bradyrhizobium sp. Leo170]TAI61489.1 hypothetical protein CWO89_34940 [Bradyrhizobium sp. Leo170]
MTSWFELIKTVPGLAKAVSELIGDISRVGSSAAKLASARIDEQRRAIEDRTSQATAATQELTEAKTAITRAIAKAAVEHIEANSAQIGERALVYGVERLIREQNNREAVVIKAIEYVSENPPSDTSTELPNDDWLNLFGRYAENATSNQMREHWAQILAGEVRKPGSFSFATLHLASILDQQLARTIEMVRPWIIESKHIPLVGPFRRGDLFEALIVLASIGFTHLGDQAIYVEDTDKPEEATRFRTDKATIVVPRYPATIRLAGKEVDLAGEPSLPSATVTRSGLELLSILPPVDQASELPEAIANYFIERGWDRVTVESPTT